VPFHARRTWVVEPIETPVHLAAKLINQSWCNCQGWSTERYLFLNDQTSPDGAFEVAVVKRPDDESGQWFQVESITFGWFTNTPFGKTAEQKAVDAIERIVSGESDPGMESSVAWPIPRPSIESPEQHGRCTHCA
jgi:hypothetical protein